ncbi:unnamed protein product [Onchocerca flexuosa]|uniref:Uncharacterized protein n=1 Tax=Onchocerca flexuosa TaxID=387005 RepID=A0A183I4D7_9BILA|nr:unnamed protein product [Onchocerca flexuosa]
MGSKLELTDRNDSSKSKWSVIRFGEEPRHHSMLRSFRDEQYYTAKADRQRVSVDQKPV